MILKGLNAISQYVGKSPSTILRWHDKWQKHGDPSLAFPLMPVGSGVGQSIIWWSNTDLIMLWMRNMSEHNAKQRVGRKKKKPRGLTAKRAGECFPPSQAKAYTRLASLQPGNLEQASLDEPNHVNSIISHT
jgi:hypothetical protein